MPKVSVIIPVYNVADTIVRCIDANDGVLQLKYSALTEERSMVFDIEKNG
jgi:GT2 family glycosyltransferase